MAVTHAMALIDKVEMGVDLDDVNIALIIKRIDAGDINRMIATNNDRQRTGFQNCANPCLNVCVALDGIRMNDIGITHIDELKLAFRQIGDVVLMVIGTGMTEREKRGGFTYAARALPRTGPPLCAEVERRTQYGDIGIECRPILLIGPFAECADTNKREIEPPALISMLGHVLPHRLLWWHRAYRLTPTLPPGSGRGSSAPLN